MHKLVTGGITALVAGGAMLAGSGPATAAPTEATASPAQIRTAPAPTQAASPAQTAAYQYHSWYWTEANCENNGARLQVRGVIRNYYCDQSPYLTYYLYVLYR